MKTAEDAEDAEKTGKLRVVTHVKCRLRSSASSAILIVLRFHLQDSISATNCALQQTQ